MMVINANLGVGAIAASLGRSLFYHCDAFPSAALTWCELQIALLVDD
jgi:hypothetical protein